VRQLNDLKVEAVRVYRADLASQPSRRGRPLSDETLQVHAC